MLYRYTFNWYWKEKPWVVSQVHIRSTYWAPVTVFPGTVVCWHWVVRQTHQVIPPTPDVSRQTENTHTTLQGTICNTRVAVTFPWGVFYQILLAVDLLSLLAHFFSRPHPSRSLKLAFKVLVARQRPTNANNSWPVLISWVYWGQLGNVRFGPHFRLTNSVITPT